MIFVPGEDDLSVGIGVFGELGGRDVGLTQLNGLVPVEVFDVITEELDIGLGDGFAGDGVGDEVIGAVAEGFIDDDRVIEPGDDAAGVAVFHFGLDEVGAGIGEGRFDIDAAVPVIGGWIEIEVPIGDFLV